MNYLKYGFLILFVSISFLIKAQVGVTGRIKTEIVSPLIVIETEQMGFGRFVSEFAGGTIRLSPQGDRVATGKIVLLDGPTVPAVFVLTGTPGSLITLKLPEVPIQLLLENGNHTLTVDHFTSDILAGGKVLNPGNGRTEINIGATLYVGNWSSNPPGFYTGTYDAVFMYN